MIVESMLPIMFQYEPERAILEVIRQHPLQLMAHKEIADKVKVKAETIKPFIKMMVVENILAEKRLGGTRIVSIVGENE